MCPSVSAFAAVLLRRRHGTTGVRCGAATRTSFRGRIGASVNGVRTVRHLRMRGTFKRLSVGRRMIADLMRYGEKIPAVPAERRMNLSALVAARQARGDRVPWTGIFIKAFALTAQEMPALRRVYMGVPWGHLYEYRATVASLAIERADG